MIKRNKENLLGCDDFGLLAECFKKITKDKIVLECHTFMISLWKNGSLSGSAIAKLRTNAAQKRELSKQSKLQR